MIYQTALEREVYEMKHAAEIHPELDYEMLQQYIKEKYNWIMYFESKIKDPQGELFDKYI